MLKEILAAGAAHCPEDASADSQDIAHGQGFLQTFHDLFLDSKNDFVCGPCAVVFFESAG